VDSSRIHDSVRSVSNLEWISQLKGSMNVLGAPLEGEAIGYPGGGSPASGL